jgi:hypothetical protein
VRSPSDHEPTTEVESKPAFGVRGGVGGVIGVGLHQIETGTPVEIGPEVPHLAAGQDIAGELPGGAPDLQRSLFGLLGWCPIEVLRSQSHVTQFRAQTDTRVDHGKSIDETTHRSGRSGFLQTGSVSKKDGGPPGRPVIVLGRYRRVPEKTARQGQNRGLR